MFGKDCEGRPVSLISDLGEIGEQATRGQCYTYSTLHDRHSILSSKTKNIPIKISALQNKCVLQHDIADAFFGATTSNCISLFDPQLQCEPLVANQRPRVRSYKPMLNYTLSTQTRSMLSPNSGRSGSKFLDEDEALRCLAPKSGRRPCPLAKEAQCMKWFSNSSHAARHARIHTGEKNAVCPDCGRRFARNDNMQHHRRTHAKQS